MINFIPLTFFGLIAIVGGAFFVHGFLNRQKIFQFFRVFSASLQGEAGRDHFAAYPWMRGRWKERDLRIFFHTSENHTVSVLNLVIDMEMRSSRKFVLLQKDGFRKPKPDQLQKLEEEVGPLIEGVDIPFDVRSPEGETVRDLFSDGSLRKILSEMTGYNQILVWDGRIMASRQFDGVDEVTPERLGQAVSLLERLSIPLEMEEKVAVS
ncbi:MAG: hypothetical protein M1297_04740 [Nitrospirae bacterium]|jgi:hypothetical protein|nr:hypothetical protein [Nitrospirota bacterium]